MRMDDATQCQWRYPMGVMMKFLTWMWYWNSKMIKPEPPLPKVLLTGKHLPVSKPQQMFQTSSHPYSWWYHHMRITTTPSSTSSTSTPVASTNIETGLTSKTLHESMCPSFHNLLSHRTCMLSRLWSHPRQSACRDLLTIQSNILQWSSRSYQWIFSLPCPF